MQMSGQGVRWRSSRVKPFNWCMCVRVCVFGAGLFGCFHRRSVLCIGGSGHGLGRAPPGRFKLLSVNVTLRYLDSNYTCQLSLSPHLSPSVSVCIFKPLAHSASPCSTRLCAHSSPFFLHLQPPAVSVSITVSEIFLLPSCSFVIALIPLRLYYLMHRVCLSLIPERFQTWERENKKLILLLHMVVMAQLKCVLPVSS